MQHPDEGTIHAWVDGALTAEEAAQIDAHVKDCAECAAAVAEARGFIAASSRILTALDNAPRGVIPAAAPAKRRLDPMVWRIAASVLVLAGGTLVVVRNQGTRGTQETASTLTMDTSGSVAAFNARVESTHAEAAKPNPSIGNRVDLPTLTVPSMPKPAPTAQKSAAPSGGAPARRVAQAPAPASVSGFLPRTAVVASEGVAADAAVGSGEPLKVIGSPQRIGANVTLYEIGGDTVTLAESRPVALSASFILEEGFPVEDVQRIATAMADAARAAGVHIVTGDTKVVQRGKGDGCYITTAGIGVVERPVRLSAAAAQPGDAVLVSGPLGDHGITVMLARGDLDLDADIASDTAPLADLTARLLDAVPETRLLRDATRGGVATILNEVAAASDVAIIVDEAAVPVRPVVTGACELLGIDPLYVACEGRFVAVVPGADVDAAIAALRADPLGADAAVIGRVGQEPPGLVLLKTSFGGTRIVDKLVGDPLPRIC